MKNRLLKIGGIVVAVLVIVYVAFGFFLGSIVTAGVNRFAPNITHTKVTLAASHISPFSGHGTLSGLYVGNPGGWSSDKAFAMETIRVHVIPSSLFGDHIVVKELVVDKPQFVYETKFLTSNIGELLKNISGSGSSGTEGQATTRSGKPIKFEVQHLRIQNGQVTVGVGAAALTLPMPTIDLTDLGSKEGGITSNQLTLAIMRSVLSSIVTATTQAAGKIGKTMGADATSGIKSLFGGKH
jgi:hypothetical protein